MNEKQKIPNNLKEHVFSYLNDVIKYMEFKRILRKNRIVMICENCNHIEAFSENKKCQNCDSYLKLFLSSEVNVSMLSRKEKYEQIKKENEEIEKREKLLKKIETETLLNEYKEAIDKIKNIDSNEILEYFIEIQKLDKYYEKLSSEKKQLLEKIDATKNDVIKELLNNKFLKIRMNKDNCDLCKSYLEEIYYCKKRFPKYSKSLNIISIKIENYLEDLSRLR